ncbi:MAG: VOC family protein [Ginsengibacter sp.]
MQSDSSIKLDIFVNYPGHCEKAFKFYEQHLGGKIIMMIPHQPIPPTYPKEWENPILHARIEIGGITIMGADIQNSEPMRSAYLAMRCDTSKKTEDIYKLLSKDGQIFMKMEKTSFANRFGMLRDKFGTSWMLLNEV